MGILKLIIFSCKKGNICCCELQKWWIQFAFLFLLYSSSPHAVLSPGNFPLPETLLEHPSASSCEYIWSTTTILAPDEAAVFFHFPPSPLTHLPYADDGKVSVNLQNDQPNLNLFSCLVRNPTVHVFNLDSKRISIHKPIQSLSRVKGCCLFCLYLFLT